MLLLFTCCTLWPLVTHSLPTFTLGWHSPLMRSAEFRPMRYATLSVSRSMYCVSLLGKCFCSYCNIRASPTLCAIRLCLLFSLLLLELHVSIVHDGSSQLINAILFLLGKAKDIKSILLNSQRFRRFSGNSMRLIGNSLCQLTSVAISSSASLMEATVVSPWEMNA